MTHSTLIHLRFSFSYFLLPIFLFSVASNVHPDPIRVFAIFIILHFLIYPASNGYNSWYDRDTSPIGGIEFPPVIDRSLIVWVTILDLLALLAAWFLGLGFFIFAVCYTLASKIYSHSKTRIKKYPFPGWLMVLFGQGACTFMGIQFGLQPSLEINRIFSPALLIPAGLISLFLAGSYPMTQIYQHEADKLHGDKSFSMVLGIKGTFFFTMAIFPIVSAGFFFYYTVFAWIGYGIMCILFQIPILVYFLFWFFKVMKNPLNANFKSTMRLNRISATCLNLFFIFIIILEHFL